MFEASGLSYSPAMELMPSMSEVTTQLTFTYLLSNVAASSPSSVASSIRTMMDCTMEVKLARTVPIPCEVARQHVKGLGSHNNGQL